MRTRADNEHEQSNQGMEWVSRGPIMDFTNFIWLWTREADNEHEQMNPVMGTRGR